MLCIHTFIFSSQLLLQDADSFNICFPGNSGTFEDGSPVVKKTVKLARTVELANTVHLQ